MGFKTWLAAIKAWLMGGTAEAATGLPRPVAGERPMARVPVDGAVRSPVPVAPAFAAPAPAPSGSARARIHAAFDTGMPVESRAGLAGRSEELNRLVEAVIENGKHGIVFGARGSGKTSLSRVFGDLADEKGAVVLYNLASGDLSFSELYRPYLTELATIPGGGLRRGDIASLLDAPFDARALASILAERVRRPVILVLDEFDRVESAATKSEVAALMKLLTDMRATTRVVTVGIAANVEDLIQGHPSLRRHMVSVPVGGIGAESLKDLFVRCCTQAGLTVEDGAASEVASAAYGSPYHLRLFGLNCALAAEKAGVSRIDREIVRIGFGKAFADWRMLSATTVDLLVRCAQLPTGHRFVIALIAYAAAMRTRVDQAEITALAIGDGSLDPAVVQAAFDMLRPILRPSAIDGQYLFDDALAPQFYLLLHSGRIDPQPADQGLRSDLRAFLEQGGPMA
ncbi:ATP-binding protein [Sphingomonas sp. NCPPB 2930]|uniref:ATP-binding protein n=1 Tax=Sphingomonas sp. NCPPB 2930 TaxID=3162788 RepID=UPI0036DD6F62